jgi:hypothetical protein
VRSLCGGQQVVIVMDYPEISPFRSFDEFDPLELRKNSNEDGLQKSALRNSIKGILTSYVGWYDPFCETIQNAMDSVDKRAKEEGRNSKYKGIIRITIDIKNNRLIVSDNGTGLSEQKFQCFLAPFYSFKGSSNRGHKGVGATYLAYGFNDVQLCTRTNEFSAVGRITGARSWVEDEDDSLERPKVCSDKDLPICDFFRENHDSGVSICVHFDPKSKPANLDWPKIDDADSWLKVLRVKTALGGVLETSCAEVTVDVISKSGKETSASMESPSYLWPHEILKNTLVLRTLELKRKELFDKGKNDDALPKKYMNRHIIYDFWNHDDIIKINETAKVFLEDSELEAVKRYKPYVYCGYVWSVTSWNDFHKKMGLRAKVKILHGGIQFAANNMPQGELHTIPFGNNIGRQNNAHVLIHWENYTPDLGRKNFQKDLIELGQKIASRLVDTIWKRYRCLKPATGGRDRDDIFRQSRVDDWKREMEEHERNHPLILDNENFFAPTKKISISATPSREQDVIALFNQMLAGGVIRGIKIMATNERSDYDGLYRIFICNDADHLYNKESNPLGVDGDTLSDKEEKGSLPFTSHPKVLEYKYSLDGLIENIDSGIKTHRDIDLVVVWETGEEWKKNYRISTLLHDDYVGDRPYHGITHQIRYIANGFPDFSMDMIVLKDLIDYLNDSEKEQEEQVKTYEEYEEEF